jgi:hypothetical protein
VPSLSHLTSCTPTKSNLYLANSVAVAVSGLSLYRLTTFQVPNLMSLFRLSELWPTWKGRNLPYWEQFLSPLQKSVYDTATLNNARSKSVVTSYCAIGYVPSMCTRDTDLDTGNNHSSVLMGRVIDCLYSFVFPVVTLEPTLCESTMFMVQLS